MIFGIILQVGFVSNRQLSINTFCLQRQNHSFCPLHFYEGSHLWECYIQSYQMCKYSFRLNLWPHYNWTSCFDNSPLIQRGTGSILKWIHCNHLEWNLPGAATDSYLSKENDSICSLENHLVNLLSYFWYTDFNLDLIIRNFPGYWEIKHGLKCLSSEN